MLGGQQLNPDLETWRTPSIPTTQHQTQQPPSSSSGGVLLGTAKFSWRKIFIGVSRFFAQSKQGEAK